MILVSIASIAGLALGGSPASATQYNNCTVEGGYFCAFEGLSYTGAKGEWIGNNNSWPTTVRDKDSSVVNLSYGYRVKVYQSTGYASGTIYCVPLNTSRPNLNAIYGVYDQGASHTFNTGIC
jgi:hypothetical protein